MRKAIPRILFDQRDYELLGIVNNVLDQNESFVYLKNLLYPYLHPRGIKELAASRALRIAYSAVRLLDSLEIGKSDDRITALRCLRDEVMHSGEGAMQKNTARVLLEIMKELVRTRDDRVRQLQLAHDFRSAATGKPRIIRSLLRRYHLLEMPEEWNQVSFDDHVHDAHTKGRKSPSHLILDAWIKGVRRLTVVYYNHVPVSAARELLASAEIMGISVRIGIEFPARFYNRYVQLIYVPRGFLDSKDFLSFLEDPRIKSFMEEGREVSEYQQQYVFRILEGFNQVHRPAINEKYGLDLQELDREEFLSFVGTGQPSILHLGIFIHSRLLPQMNARVAELREGFEGLVFEERRKIALFVDELNKLDSEAIVDLYLRPVHNPGIPDPHVPREGPDVPRLMQLTPCELIDRLTKLHTGCRITLNLSNLSADDVLELLYGSKGAITHLEIFNLKDFSLGKTTHQEIIELQRAINDGNVISLKKYIRAMIRRLTETQGPDAPRIGRLNEILADIASLQNYYKHVPLRSRIGSDSTGHSRRLHGMGLALLCTLPRRAQREVRSSFRTPRWIIPIKVDAFLRTTRIPPPVSGSPWGWLLRMLSRFPVLHRLLDRNHKDWEFKETSTCMAEEGNIVTLGGISEERGNCLEINPRDKATKARISWRYLNGILRDALKVLIGFGPAFATFYFTKDWWLLAYFGGAIWLGITFFRNIVQSVLGAGGVWRSPLLKWNSYVSWDRLSDSLLYTGLSVPLLEYLVKTVILERSFDITAGSDPVLLYSIMAVANGLYIFSHNTWRGLPRAAAVGNLFRTVISIPLALLFNSAVGGILAGFAVQDIAGVLQKWAAIISKTASDCVAGVIEGLADRYKHTCMREKDYATKLGQLYDAYSQLELIYPQTDVLKMLESPKRFMRKLGTEARDLEKIMIINALDLLYFWMYQPRARGVLCSLLRGMSNDERQIFLRSQSVLRRDRETSQLIVNGIVGRNFARALSFYLDRSEAYLDTLEELAYKPCGKDVLLWWPRRLRSSCRSLLGLHPK